MISWILRARAIALSGCLIIAAVLVAGCERDGGGGESPPLTTNDVVDTTSSTLTTNTLSDPYFPDGLHPNSKGSDIIAGVFARQISPVMDAGDNDTNTVVCLGDSITDRGYPAKLASKTGMNAIEEGTGGERSSGGASRVADVLDQYHPAYLCILYGANDVIDDVPPETVVANLQTIIDAAKDNGTIPIVGTLTPMSGERKAHAADARAVSAAIRGMAGATGTRLADLEAAF